MRRRGNGSIFGGIITLFVVLSIFGSLSDLLIEGFAIVFAMGLILTPFVLIGLGIKWLIEKIKGKETGSIRNRSTTVARRQGVSTVSNADMAKVDKRLTEYFMDHGSLPLIDGVSLVTNNGQYMGVGMLYLSYNDEKIVRLDDFRLRYPDVYSRIYNMLVIFAKHTDEVIGAEVKSEKIEVKKENILSDADRYISKINDLNKVIPQEEVTNGLYLTCDLLKQIDLAIKKDEKKNDGKITKLYDYYLPILVSVLEKYRELSESPIKGEEFKDCETQLIKTVLLINEALKTIYSSIHEDDYMNLSADIGTLQTLLAKDGYSDNPFGSK